MTKIFLATPAYSGKVNVQYAICLADTQTHLASKNIETHVKINTAGSLLVAERNRLLKSFLETDCTHMLFIDGDLGWPYQAVEALLNHDEDFVGGVYPARGNEKIFMFRPLLNPDSSIVKSEKKLLGMEYIPSGFMLIKRHVIEKIIADNPQTYFKPKHGDLPDGHCIFNTEVYEDEFWGEDYVFCRLARRSGFKIWVDPLIQFDHDGTIGMLLNVLTDKPQDQHAIDKK